jgi:hypothetical protein
MRRLLLICLIAGAAAFSTAGSATAAPFMLSVIQDDNQLVYSSAQNRNLALRRMQAMGADAVRVTVLWNAIAPRKRPKNPADPRSYYAPVWDKYDDVVRVAQYFGLQVYFDITPPGPRWSQATANNPKYQRSWKPNTREFDKFVQAVGRRYSGTYRDENQGKGLLPRVSWWGIGNEPNQPGWLMPQSQKGRGGRVATSPGLYRRMLIAGADGLIRTGHGQDTVNFGETAPLGSPPKSDNNPLPPGLFIRDLFCLDSRFRPYRGAAAAARDCGTVRKLSILKRLPRLVYAHHPYTKKLPPDKVDPHRDSVTMANLGVLPGLLDRVAQRTKLIPEGLGIVLTEFGYETNPPDPYAGIPLDKQAEWNNIGDYLAYKQDRVFANTQFLLFDVPPLTKYPKGSRAYWFTYQSGLYFQDGRPKPSAPAYMMPFVANRAGGGYGFWGQVRFTPNGADQTVFLQRKDGAGDWQNVGDPIAVTNAMGFWEASLPASPGETWRALWTAPDQSSSAASREITLR